MATKLSVSIVSASKPSVLMFSASISWAINLPKPALVALTSSADKLLTLTPSSSTASKVLSSSFLTSSLPMPTLITKSSSATGLIKLVCTKPAFKLPKTPLAPATTLSKTRPLDFSIKVHPCFGKDTPSSESTSSLAMTPS